MKLSRKNNLPHNMENASFIVNTRKFFSIEFTGITYIIVFFLELLFFYEFF